ncbi:MAG TPA: hypothetical protein PLQ35_16775 [bacterium]|nr:hypothetical protein [bacterium]
MNDQKHSRLVMLSVMLTPEQKDLLEKRREQEGIPMSFCVRNALAEWIAKDNPKHKLLKGVTDNE